jgi:hypothetical protein
MDSSKMNLAVVGPYRTPSRFKKFMNGKLIISRPATSGDGKKPG